MNLFFPFAIVLAEVSALKLSMLQMYVIRTMGNNQYMTIKLNGNGKMNTLGKTKLW